jgi:type IV fimbrial biogenesis protein FimT
MQKLLTHHNTSGFSLMEVMIVVAIIAITAALALPNMIGKRADAKLQGAINNLKGDLNVAKSMAVRENANVVILFEADGYQVFVDNGEGLGGIPNNWQQDGEERLLRNRRLPAGVSIDLAAPDHLDTDRTRFNERGLPHPAYLGTITVVDGSDGQGKIEINRLGRLAVQLTLD